MKAIKMNENQNNTNKISSNNSDNSIDNSKAASHTGKISLSDLAKAREKREKEREEEKAKKPKSKKSKKVVKDIEVPTISLDEANQFLIPVFDLASLIMENRGVEGLDDEEKERGVEVFLPLINRFMPMLGENSIFIPPIFWTAGVIFARTGARVELPEIEPKKEKTDAN